MRDINVERGLVRDNENSAYRVLSPCGICQERLRYWGEEFEVIEKNEIKAILFDSGKVLKKVIRR